jgi:hypothetical protein
VQTGPDTHIKLKKIVTFFAWLEPPSFFSWYSYMKYKRNLTVWQDVLDFICLFKGDHVSTMLLIEAIEKRGRSLPCPHKELEITGK